ncbi:hypothetical protein [Thauera phenylacetica]
MVEGAAVGKLRSFHGSSHRSRDTLPGKLAARTHRNTLKPDKKRYQVSKKASKALNLIWVAFSLTLPAAFNFLFLLIIARTQSVETYGSVVFAITISVFIISFSDLGLRDFLLSKTAIKNNLSEERNLFYTSTPSFFLFAIAGILYAALTASTQISTTLILLLIPETYALGVLQKTVFLTYQNKDSLVRFSKIDSTIKTATSIAKIVAYTKTESVIVAVGIISIINFSAYSIWFKKSCWISEDFLPVRRALSNSIITVLKKYNTWIYYTISFFSFYTYSAADKLIIAGKFGEEKLALYMAAFSLVSLGQIFVSAIWSLYMPRISRDPTSISRRALFVQATLLGLTFFLCYKYLGALAIKSFYPPSYLESIQIISILSLFFLFRFPNVIFEIYWVAEEKYNLFVKIRLAAATISILINLTLMPILGFQTAAWAMVFSELLIFLIMTYFQIGSRVK